LQDFKHGLEHGDTNTWDDDTEREIAKYDEICNNDELFPFKKKHVRNQQETTLPIPL
jgi:hypothetical protein